MQTLQLIAGPSGTYMCRHGEQEVLDLWVAGAQFQFCRPLVRKWERSGAAANQAGIVKAPMPGKIVKASVQQAACCMVRGWVHGGALPLCG